MATLDDYDFDNMTSIDLIEDIENKMEDLIEEKIEIVVNLFKLRFTEGIDNESYMNILSFIFFYYPKMRPHYKMGIF